MRDDASVPLGSRLAARDPRSVARHRLPLARDSAWLNFETRRVARDQAPVARGGLFGARDSFRVTRDTAPVTRNGAGLTFETRAVDRESAWLTFETRGVARVELSVADDERCLTFEPGGDPRVYPREPRDSSRLARGSASMATTKTPTIADVLSEARVAIRFTQEDFAVHLGISRRTLSRWEGGHTVPTAHELQWVVQCLYEFGPAVAERAARALGVPSPGPKQADYDRALAAAATSLGIPSERLAAALVPLVAEWRARGCTLEQVAASLAPRRREEEEK